ncbi:MULTISPECIES: hypothetical protein [Haloferax]|uniref:Uncharacterized protein n=1 Tax=Haloferax larsenii TaxID=302484 RepID=A0A1H7SKK6_HALLR|nr:MULTISPECIES: hypothetical protein [Haloferax]SEL72919.1 hypothetical protein SAMN04488691_107114 [Haloferax larsenii]
MSGTHKRTANFSSMAQAMRACGTWEPESPLEDDALGRDEY